VYLRESCRYLEPEDASCRVHATREQPHICASYNPYNCWYQRSLGEVESENYLRIDRQRLAVILDRVRFDDERNVIESPPWEELQEAFPSSTGVTNP
jgi:hypothetical protein